MISDEAIELAKKTWYPVDHPLHNKAHHPLGKLLGEWGELLDDYMKSLYKPNYKSNFVDELGDIWYYIRILCYQRDYQPEPDMIFFPNGYLARDYEPDKLINFAIFNVSRAFDNLTDNNDYPIFAVNLSFAILLELLDRQHLTLDELTELNWQKLQPGSERGEQWMKAHDGT